MSVHEVTLFRENDKITIISGFKIQMINENTGKYGIMVDGKFLEREITSYQMSGYKKFPRLCANIEGESVMFRSDDGKIYKRVYQKISYIHDEKLKEVSEFYLDVCGNLYTSMNNKMKPSLLSWYKMRNGVKMYPKVVVDYEIFTSTNGQHYTIMKK